MKFGRFMYENKVFYGIVGDQEVIELKAGPFGGEIKTAGNTYGPGQLRVLAPCAPTKAVCVGLNYRDHAEEFGHKIPGEPVLFIKPSTAVIGPGEAIILPRTSVRVDYEAELAIVIGRTCRKAPPASAAGYILGYTCANDVTARDLQERDGQWTRSKSFDTFLPLGPYIVSEIDPSGLAVRLYLNRELKQSSSTRNLIFDVYNLVSFISEIMTLHPGDVILTGTPAGVGPMASGDKVEVEIEGIGRLENMVEEGKNLNP